jgi:hypothetical protein
MASLIGTVYFFELIGLLIILLLGYLIWDKRYKRNQPRNAPKGFVKTNEVSIDPITKKKQRVYYDPETGERLYIEED